MANPVRLSVLCVLMEGARTVGGLETMLGVHQPTLSQQMTELRQAAMITGLRVGRAVRYRLSDPKAAQIIGHVRLLFPDPEASLIWRGAQFDIDTQQSMS